MKRWEKWEEDYLLENYQYMDTLDLQKVLANRSYQAIKKKATSMGVSKDIYLKEGLTYSPKEVGDILGLSEWTIRKYAKRGYISQRVLTCKGKKFHKFTTENILAFMIRHPSKWINKPYDSDMIQTLMIDYQGKKKAQVVGAIRSYLNLSSNSVRVAFRNTKDTTQKPREGGFYLNGQAL